MDEIELGAFGRGGLAQRAAAVMQARRQAQAGDLARLVGQPVLAIAGKPFQIAATITGAVTTGTATVRPLQGIRPERASAFAYASTGTPAAGVDLISGILIGTASQLVGTDNLPVAVLDPAAQNVGLLRFDPIPSQTPVQLNVTRTVAPGAGTAQTTVLTIFGQTIG